MNQSKTFKLFLFAFLSIAIILSMQFVAAQSAVNLGTAGNYAVLAKSGISTTGTTEITGNIGVSPIDSTGITGFGLIMDSSNEFATSSLVTGNIYASDYTSPTDVKMTTAVSDMETAYTDAAGRTNPTATELGAGEIGGMTLAPGLYKWSTGLLISTDVTLSGSSTDVWIFQIAGTLDIASGKKVILAGGAQAKNVFWQVADATTIGTTATFNGNILDLKEIVLNTGATLNGLALSQTAVTLDANVVSSPGTASTISTTATITTSTGGSSSDDESSDDESSSGSAVTTTQGSGAVVSVTTPKKIIDIVAGASVTITQDGETVKVIFVDGKKRLTSGSTNVETELPVETEENTIRVTQSNGAKTDVKIMPSAASDIALARLKLKVCSVESNCTIVLKEVGNGTETRLVYQMKAQKDVKILGLFRAKMNIETNVDAETKEIISTKIPWWYLISSDASE